MPTTIIVPLMRYVLFGTAIDYNFVNFTKLQVSQRNELLSISSFEFIGWWKHFVIEVLENQVHNYMF